MKLLSQGFFHFCLVAIAFLVLGCGNTVFEAKEDRPEGRLLIWHPFQGREAETLNIILDDYRKLYPKVKIVMEFVPEDTISERFRQKSQSSLGPDLMISSYVDLITLIRAKTVLNLNDYGIDVSTYLPGPIRQVTHQDNLYGLPFSLNTQVLCYNKTRVDEPLTTLPEMIQQLEAKHQIALTSNFVDTLWGLEIFNEESSSQISELDPDSSTLNNNRQDFIFNPQAWAAWLKWLLQANNYRYLILADDRSTLHQKFAETKLDYYFCKSEEISDLKAILGEDKLGVTNLPGIVDRPAVPLLFTRALVFNRVSSPTAIKLALHLAQFLTNGEQQTKLAIQTESLIPANKKVKLDERLSPIQAVLFSQSKTAVAVSLDYLYQFDHLQEKYGDLYYKLVIEGVMTPQEAALELQQKIAQVVQQETIQLREE